MMVFSSLGAQSCFEIDRRRRRRTTATTTTTKQKRGVTIPPKISHHTSLVFLGSGFNQEPSRALESVIICDNLPEWKWQMKSLIISSFQSFQSFHQLGETFRYPIFSVRIFPIKMSMCGDPRVTWPFPFPFLFIVRHLVQPG